MLYLIDEPMADIGFRTAAGDDDARVVLVQDGVLLASDLAKEDETVPDLDAPTYAVARDVEVRGVDLPSGIEPVSYDTLMTLVEEHEVKTFA